MLLKHTEKEWEVFMYFISHLLLGDKYMLDIFNTFQAFVIKKI